MVTVLKLDWFRLFFFDALPLVFYYSSSASIFVKCSQQLPLSNAIRHFDLYAKEAEYGAFKVQMVQLGYFSPTRIYITSFISSPKGLMA